MGWQDDAVVSAPGAASWQRDEVVSAPTSRVDTIPGVQPQRGPAPEPSFMEKLKGVGEAGLSLGTGIFGGGLGYVGGALGGIAGSVASGKFGTPEGSNMATQSAQEGAQKLTYAPRGEPGQSYLRSAGEAIAPLAALGPMAEMATLATAAPAAARQATAAVAPKVAQAVSTAVENRPFQRPKNELLDMNVQEAKASGYVLTPRQASPNSTTANLVEGASGSAKMEKLASIKNQKVTNRLVSDDLRMDPRKPITAEALADIRKTEGAAYQAVKDSGVPLRATEKYQRAIDELGGDFKAANAELPGLIDNPAIDKLIKSLRVEKMTAPTAVEAVKYLRSESTKNLKAGFADPEKGSLGMAQRKAANAIDDLIENSLDDAGKGSLAADYRKARVRIAKTHTVESALNETTGNVDALYLARLMDKGKPMSGGIEKAARFGQSFSGAARSVDNMKDAANFSFADLALGAAGHIATGNMAGLAAVAARPAMRAAALSKLGQKAVGP